MGAEEAKKKYDELSEKISKEERAQKLIRKINIDKQSAIKVLLDAKAEFDKFDKDHSKALEKNELEAMITELWEKVLFNKDEYNIDNILKKFDTNKDGLIDLEEFIHLFINYLADQGIKGNFHLKFRKSFNESDVDKSGFIEKNEIIQVIKGLYPEKTDDERQKYADKIFKEFDKNNDGKVDFDEFCRVVFIDNMENILKTQKLLE